MGKLLWLLRKNWWVQWKSKVSFFVALLLPCLLSIGMAYACLGVMKLFSVPTVREPNMVLPYYVDTYCYVNCTGGIITNHTFDQAFFDTLEMYDDGQP